MAYGEHIVIVIFRQRLLKVWTKRMWPCAYLAACCSDEVRETRNLSNDVHNILLNIFCIFR